LATAAQQATSQKYDRYGKEGAHAWTQAHATVLARDYSRCVGIEDAEPEAFLCADNTQMMNNTFFTRNGVNGAVMHTASLLRALPVLLNVSGSSHDVSE